MLLLFRNHACDVIANTLCELLSLQAWVNIDHTNKRKLVDGRLEHCMHLHTSTMWELLTLYLLHAGMVLSLWAVSSNPEAHVDA